MSAEYVVTIRNFVSEKAAIDAGRPAAVDRCKDRGPMFSAPLRIIMVGMCTEKAIPVELRARRR